MTKQIATAQDIIAATGATQSAPIRTAERWEAWTAEYQVAGMPVKRSFLLMNRDSRWQDIEEAALYAASLSQPTVVIRDSARTLRADMPRVRKRFGSLKVVTLSHFLFDVVTTALAPSEVLAAEADPYFIEPSVLFPTEEEAAPALSRLTSWLKGDADSECNVAVLLAPAGVGKTTLSEQVFRQLLKGKAGETIPLLLKREQWEPMASRGSVQLRDIWTSAITTWYPRSLLGSQGLETYLAAGAIRPIFDGLDELCSGLPGDFTPTGLIEDLADTFEEGRLLVTSRTQYWDENVAKSVRARVLELELRPFSPAQRDKYLEKRFPRESAKRSAALRLLERVSGRTQSGARPAADPIALDPDASHTSRFDVMPYAVMLAAESVDGDVGRAEQLLDDREPITGLLMALCERETQRQRLSLDAGQQFRLLELIAIEFGATFTSEEFELVASDVRSDIARRELDRLEHHALLRVTDDRLRFRYEFVQEYLAARVIRNWLFDEQRHGASVGERALRRCSERPLALIERWVDLTREFEEVEVLDALRARWDKHKDDPAKAAGLAHLALGFSRARASGDKARAVQLLHRAVGQGEGTFRNLRIRGPISALDLSGIAFVDCTFTDTEWVKCTLSKTTHFLRCTFDGRLSFQSVVGLRDASFVDNVLSAHAAAALQREREDDVGFAITEEQIVEAIRETLRLFSVGNMGFKPINVPKLDKHLQGYSFGEKIRRTLVAEGVLAVQKLGLAGGAERYVVTDTYAARQFLNDSLRLAGIASAIASLKQRLVK